MTKSAVQVKFPYRYDVVGSLLRTQALKDAHAKYNAGQINADELKAVQHEETKNCCQAS